MMQSRTIEPQDKSRARRSLSRQVLALLIMLLAVVPHLTLAASPLAGVARMAMNQAPSTAEAAARAVPCHEQRSDPEHPNAQTACCILGCGLLVDAPAVTLPSRTIAWSPMPRPETIMRAGISREPVKPPPRPEPASL